MRLIPNVEKHLKLLVLGLYRLHRTCSGNSQLNRITSHANVNVFDYKASMSVGTLSSENFSLSVLTDSDPQKHTAFDLRPWERLPKLCDNTEVVTV